jgi:hypothetical protein
MGGEREWRGLGMRSSMWMMNGMAVCMGVMWPTRMEMGFEMHRRLLRGRGVGVVVASLGR